MFKLNELRLLVIDRLDRREQWNAAIESAVKDTGTSLVICTSFLYDFVSRDRWYEQAAMESYLSAPLSSYELKQLIARFARGEPSGNDDLDRGVSRSAIAELCESLPYGWASFCASIVSGNQSFDYLLGAQMSEHTYCPTRPHEASVSAVFWTGRNLRRNPWGSKLIARPSDRPYSSMGEIAAHVVRRMSALKWNCESLRGNGALRVNLHRDYWV